jgi:hypothetical protein
MKGAGVEQSETSNDHIETEPTGYGPDKYEYVTGYPRIASPYHCYC